MPFAVIRKHQKKLLAVFAILAMFGFVLSDSLMKMTNQGSGRNGNPVVVDLYGGPIYRSDLELLAKQRSVANQFIAVLTRGQIAARFGGYNTRELVDALVLKHEADRLKIPDSTEFAQNWLKKAMPEMNKQLFELMVRQLGQDVGGSQVLASLSSQLRLDEARRLLGEPVVTPLDVYNVYRDQNERSTFKFVSFPAANFLDKVGEPTAAEVEALYEKYKDVLPDPLKSTPGFKIPREVKVEILSIDIAKIAKGIQEKLSKPEAEAELKAYYETHKADYKVPSELPYDVFKDDPAAALTPPRYIPFADQKDVLIVTLAREKAQEQITEIFTKIKDEVIDDFSDKYHDAVAENADAKRNGESARVPVPKPMNLADVAKANGLDHEITPLLTYEEAKNYGQIGGATMGSNPNQPSGTKFADAEFAPKSPLYDSMEFTTTSGMRFLTRKLEDVEPHVAPLQEVKPEVIAAWKLEKARGLAEVAAKELAESLKKQGGKFKDKEEIVSGRPVISTDPVTKLTPSMPNLGFGQQFGPPKKSELRQIPNVSESLREALFSLQSGDLAVDTDATKSTYYVVTLERREPASFTGLYGPIGMPFAYLNDAFTNARFADDKERMDALRAKAGLKPDWVPNDEKDRPETDRIF
jgi:hypothetical protein